MAALADTSTAAILPFLTRLLTRSASSKKEKDHPATDGLIDEFDPD